VPAAFTREQSHKASKTGGGGGGEGGGVWGGGGRWGEGEGGGGGEGLGAALSASKASIVVRSPNHEHLEKAQGHYCHALATVVACCASKPGVEPISLLVWTGPTAACRQHS